MKPWLGDDTSPVAYVSRLHAPTEPSSSQPGPSDGSWSVIARLSSLGVIHGRASSASSKRRAARVSQGFTLIELLIVVSLMVILLGMLMPLVAMAKRSSLRTVTLSIMSKTDFISSGTIKGHLHQLSYAKEGQPWTNALYYNVGTDIAAADMTAVKADMRAAAGDYAYDITNLMNGWGPAQTGGIQTFTENRQNGSPAMDGNGTQEGDPSPSSNT